jgi:hypothetical protein
VIIFSAPSRFIKPEKNVNDLTIKQPADVFLNIPETYKNNLISIFTVVLGSVSASFGEPGAGSASNKN